MADTLRKAMDDATHLPAGFFDLEEADSDDSGNEAGGDSGGDPNEIWNCVACTLENPGNRSSCGVCGTGRVYNAAEQAARQERVTCLTATQRS